MNARSIKKRLMRNRVNSIWGRRAYLTVRMPLSLVGAPPPEPQFPGLTQDFDGHWVSADEREIVYIRYAVMGCDPRPHATPGNTPCFVQADQHGDHVFWTGTRTIVHDDEKHTSVDLPEEIVGQYRAFVLWFQDLRNRSEHPIVRAFVQVSEHGKSFSWFVDAEGLYAQYSVAWHHYNDRARFCSDLARALKLAKRSGIPARVVA